MGFERNYQVKNLSNQLNKKQYSTFYLSPVNPKLAPG
jgi:hypothetical protein